MNNFCHNDLVFSFSQIYQIIIIWNNQRNIFHHHSQNQAKEKRPFKTSLPLRQSNAHPSQQNAPVRLICARTGPILSQIYRPIKLMFKKSVQTPFKIKMQFNSIKLFARFVFLGWLFNFISNLLLFNQTDYVLLYTVFTHFVLPPLDSSDIHYPAGVQRYFQINKGYVFHGLHFCFVAKIHFFFYPQATTPKKSFLDYLSHIVILIIISCRKREILPLLRTKRSRENSKTLGS